MTGSRRPSILFFNRFYWPDIAATAQMLTDLAEDLAAAGWTVTVVTSGGGYEKTGEALPQQETRNGVYIRRVGGTGHYRHHAIGRIKDYLGYLMRAGVEAFRLPRTDVVAAMTDPPFVIAVALLVARMRRAKCVYWIQDLFPEIAAQLGFMRSSGFPYKVALGLAHWLHGRCDLVIALGPQMARRLVDAGAHVERTTFVHNWADAAAIVPIPAEENPFVDRHELAGRFIVLYSGNAGRAHRFDGVLRAAGDLRGESDVLFLFIGGGKRYPELRETARSKNLANVRFLDYLPRADLKYSLSSANVSLVTEDEAVLGLLVPSKVYGILASGRPVIFMGSSESDVARIIREADCGVVLRPDDAAGLAAVILALRTDPARAAKLGRHARQAMERLYDRHIATSQWAMTVESLVNGRLPTAPGSAASTFQPPFPGKLS